MHSNKLHGILFGISFGAILWIRDKMRKGAYSTMAIIVDGFCCNRCMSQYLTRIVHILSEGNEKAQIVDLRRWCKLWLDVLNWTENNFVWPATKRSELQLKNCEMTKVFVFSPHFSLSLSLPLPLSLSFSANKHAKIELIKFCVCMCVVFVQCYCINEDQDFNLTKGEEKISHSRKKEQKNRIEHWTIQLQTTSTDYVYLLFLLHRPT